MDCIANLDSMKWLYLSNPESDFTRDRKITFEKFINICLQMEDHALQNELLKYFHFEEDTPTKSAFCQQRATMVAKYRKKAIKELDVLYEERDRQTENFILR